MNINKYFLIAIFYFSTNAGATQTEKYKIWSDKDYEFSYPNSWKIVKPNENAKESCIYLTTQPLQTDLNKIYDFRICKYYENVQVASQKSAFRKQNNKWIAAGSMDQQVAKIKFQKRKIIIETDILPSCGITDADGLYHSAGGECYSAIVGNKTISIILQSAGDNKDVISMRNITKSVILKLK